MEPAEPFERDTAIACQRDFGRAAMTIRTNLLTPQGKVGCHVVDLSLGGAKLEPDRALAPGASLWLALKKLKVFATVQWSRGNMIGVQFEERLPKTLMLSLRGDKVDPRELEAIETMLHARNFVIGTPINRPKALRLADILGVRGESIRVRPRRSLTARLRASLEQRRAARARAKTRARTLDRARTRERRGFNRRALLLILASALAGSGIGIASVMLF